ncbi:MAG: peptidoglycan DD-metalloendopeptidase family protein [Bacteroidaceae bacterium]|nr:peptidoglycan DD-metalloendopeptidase family protein [Bacteroidaceae bacterium]
MTQHTAILRNVAVTLLLTLSTVFSAQAQDLLARQAPVDRRMRSVDTLTLRSLTAREGRFNPAGNLYSDFSSRSTHVREVLPESYRIDLRRFHMPTPSRVITSNFGPRWGRVHKGLDIKVYIGDTIRAAWSGRVRVVRYEAKGYGNYVIIRHENGLETYYGHLSKQLVSENQRVRAGQPIGLGGNTGRSTGSHLHFETRLCGVALNPALFFDFRAQDITGDYYDFRRSTIERESARATQLRGKHSNTYNPADVHSSNAPRGGQKTTASKSTGSQAQFHKVEAGETVYSIARKRGVTVEELCRKNGIGSDLRIRPGQLLAY